MVDYKYATKNLGPLMFHYVFLVLAIQRKDDIDRWFFMYEILFLVSFFSFLSIPRVTCKMPSLGEKYDLSQMCLIREHH